MEKQESDFFFKWIKRIIQERRIREREGRGFRGKREEKKDIKHEKKEKVEDLGCSGEENKIIG